VAARQDGRLVGSGEVTRVVVDAERFMARIGPVTGAAPLTDN
jgi:predicted thioesterase